MRIIALSACLCVAHLAEAQPFEWTQLTAFPGTARDDASAFAIGSGIYLGTGREVGWGFTTDWFRFDVDLGTWENVAPLPASGRQYCTAFSIDGIGYLFGGNNDDGWLNELWSYDPSNDSWEQRASPPTAGRSGSVSFVINGSAYIVTGRIGANTLSNALWRYDPLSDSWSEGSTMPGPARHLAAAFTLDGRAYVVGGADDQGTNLASGWCYDASTATWTALPDLPDARFGADGYSVSGYGLIVGGATNASNFPETCYWYRPWDDTWVMATEPAPGVRKGGSGAAVADHVYYGTGVNNVERLNDWHRMDVPVSISSVEPTAGLSLSPVPATDHIQLHGTLTPQFGDATLWSIRGEFLGTMNAMDLQRPIKVAHLVPGTYVLKVNIGGGQLTFRFIRMEE
ncbi:MAG TPA: kelch repeat-containing protein [Flavobacteriales bacterium]|nr:kelch repeat-containing protein [Flavobacteriales bacterium]